MLDAKHPRRCRPPRQGARLVALIKLLAWAGCWTSSTQAPTTPPPDDPAPPPPRARPDAREDTVVSDDPPDPSTLLARCRGGFVVNVIGMRIQHTSGSSRQMTVIIGAGVDKGIDPSWTATVLPSTPAKIVQVAPGSTVLDVPSAPTSISNVEVCPP